MRNKICKIVLFSVVMFFGFLGCASFPEPVDGKGMVVGQFESNGTGYKDFGQASLNGRVTRGIELTFYDNTRGKDIVIKTNGTGMFNTDQMLPGSYRFSKAFIKVNGSDHSWISLYVVPHSDSIFTVKDGVINNLGKISCYIDDVKRTTRFQGNTEYREVESYFMKRMAKTNWTSWDWQDVFIQNISN